MSAKRLAVVLLMLTFVRCATADTTVGDDNALRAALRAAKPGDVIKIKPGNYAGGIYQTMAGEKGKPITIEAADPKDPPRINGGDGGMQLAQSKYVTLRNIRFTGAKSSGLNIDDGGSTDTPAVGIVLENITVTDIQKKGNCDGIKLSGVTDFIVRDCTIEGWGGSAIDMVGCTRGLIEECTFRGKKGFEQATGPQMKGGSSEIVIRACRFDDAGDRGINCGGSTGIPFFRPKDAGYEAKNITIEKCVFRGSHSPIAFVGVDGAMFRQNTIIDPQRFVLRILQESTGERFVKCRNVTFEKNLVIYKRAGMVSVVNIGTNTAPETFVFKDNWWYCTDAPQSKPQLPGKEAGSVYGRDPKLKLDKDGFPTNPPGAPAAEASR